MTNMDLTRRTFVVTTAAAGGGLLLGVGSASAAVVNGTPWMAPTDKAGTEINQWLVIDPSGLVTIRYAQVEMGQGASTSTPMMIAEELQADWTMVRAQFADANRHVNNNNLYVRMDSSASRQVELGHFYYLQAGASARERLKEAAAKAWGVNRSQITAKDGMLSSGAFSGTFGEFATRAAEIQLPEEPGLKSPDQYTLIGTSVARLDTPLKVNGSAQYGIDVRIPGIVYAAVQQSPVPGGTLLNYDFDAIRDRPGVIQAVEFAHSRLLSGVAVVADSWYRAKTALELMPIEWDPGAGAGTDTNSLLGTLRSLLDVPGEIELADTDGTLINKRFGMAEKLTVGDAPGIIANSSNVVTADYERPYANHARMEPMNCTVSIADNRVDVFLGAQSPHRALTSVADQLGVDTSIVFVHNHFLGGGFGSGGGLGPRPAAEIASQVGRPVKMLWSREEDLMQDQQRAMAMARFSAALGPNGMPEALFTRSASDDHRSAMVRAREFVAFNLLNEHYEDHKVKGHLPVTWLRSTTSGQWGFGIDSFTDEMALAGGWDPLEFRIELTKHLPDWQVVWGILKDHSGFTTDLPRGEGMGVAASETHGTICAQCQTVTISRRGQLRLEKVVAVVDPGIAVNPSIIVGQVESSIVYELSHTVRGTIEIRDGQVASNNFDTFQIMRINEMPEIEVVVAPSGSARWGMDYEPPLELRLGGDGNIGAAAARLMASGDVTPQRKSMRPGGWGGLGEPNGFATPPALANAIFQASGKRVRSTPFANHDLSWS